MQLVDVSQNEIALAKENLKKVWQKAYDNSPSIQALYKVEGYRQLMKFGFLCSLDYLIEQIDETGTLNTDSALKQRKKDHTFDPDFHGKMFERSVTYLAEHWPYIAVAIARVGRQS